MTRSAADAFLEPVGAAERSWLRIAAVCLGGVTLSLAATVVVIALVGGIMSLGAGPDDLLELLTEPGTGRPLMSYGPVFAVAGLSLAAAGYAFLQIASRLYRRPIRSFLTAAPRFRWRAVAAGLLIAAPIALAALAIETAWAPREAPPPLLDAGETLSARLSYALLASFFLYLAALGEEAVFRGWMLQQAAAFIRRRWTILILTGLAFSLVHADLEPTALLVRTALGVGFGWMVLKTGGVEFASGAHLANNLMIALFAGPPSLQASASDGFNIGGFALQALAVLAIALVLQAALARPRLAHRLGLSL